MQARASHNRTAQVATVPTRAYGLMRLHVGASLIVRGADKVRRQYIAHERRPVMGRAQSEGREIKVVCRCFTCSKDYSTDEELLHDHPSEEEMAKDEQAHVYAWWCEDNADAHGKSDAAVATKEIDALKAAQNDLLQKITKMVNIEEVTAARNRLKDLQIATRETEERRAKILQNIVGILTDPVPEG